MAAQRADNCRRARTHMATLDSGMRMSRTNDKGEREVLDDKQRADEINAHAPGHRLGLPRILSRGRTPNRASRATPITA